MSDLLFTCLKCSKHLAIDVKGCGSTIKCPDCDAPVNVPFAKVFFKCQACRNDLCAPNGIGGKDYTCPSCGNKVAIPQSAETSKIQDKRICPKCGHSNATESTFCAECGITLNSRISPATDKRCPKCEVIISPSDAIFCANCGMSFNAVTNPSTYTPAPNRLLKVKPAESNIREKSLYYKTAYGMAPEACDKKCPYCSNRLPSDAVVCVNCGIDLRSGKKLKMQRPEPKSDFDPLPYIKVGAICLALWGCYAGYQAYKGSSGNGGSSIASVFGNTAEDDKLYDYVKAKMALTSDIGARKNLIDSYMSKFPSGKHSGEIKALAEHNDQSIAQWNEQQKYGNIEVKCFATLGNGNVIPVQGWVQLIESPTTAAAHIIACSEEINELTNSKHKMEQLGNMESYIQMNFMSFGRTLCKVPGRAMGGVTLSNGTAVFKDILPGNYILYGSGRAGISLTGWFQDVNVSGGQITTITPNYYTCSYERVYAWKPYPWRQ